jgi:ABC-type sugar transport system, permease component
MKSPLILFSQLSLNSYITAFSKMNFGESFLNSLVLTVGSVIVVVLVTSLAAYPMGKIQNKMARFLYIFFVAGLVVPGQMVIIPIAKMFSFLNIPSTRFTPMILFITCSIPFSTFLYTGFMKGVPTEVEESAYIDGAGLLRRFFQIVFPLLIPATISVVITQATWIWNDYFYPLIFITNSNQFPLPLSMLGFMGDKENPGAWNVLFAACILCTIPLIAAFATLQKYFVSGISAGAVKG